MKNPRLHAEIKKPFAGDFIFILSRHVCATSVKKFIDVRESICFVGDFFYICCASLKCKIAVES